MQPTRPKDWKPGDPIEAKRLNEMQRAPLLAAKRPGTYSYEQGDSQRRTPIPRIKFVQIAADDDTPSTRDRSGEVLAYNVNSEEWELLGEAVDNVIDLEYSEGTITPCVSHNGKLVPLSAFTRDCTTVEFTIVSSDPETRTALGEIAGRPCNCEAGDIPDTMLGGTVIEICDPAGCFFNEPNDELIGRRGWARYMMPVTVNTCQPDPRYLTCMWHVFSLCCETPTCEEQQ